ncbi:MAG: recombinase family protein [Blastocatellia bacterium]|nr:recombinase family protein [Blastocatellia bacterium]
MKALGGIAPFGYRWKNGRLVIDEKEAPVRKLIYELFLKHRRKKTVAKLLNDLGYRTRNASLFSDTTIDRLLRDAIAKGTREGGGKKIEVDPIISAEVWERVNNILGSKPSKQATELFTAIVYCACGGKMIVPSNSPKYVCLDCRRKILTNDLEAIFHSQLKSTQGTKDNDLYEQWDDLSQKERRLIVEQMCERIVVERDTIHIEFGYSPHTFKAMIDGQRNLTDNESLETNNLGAAGATALNEPLLSEVEAAKFLGISKMNLFRKRRGGGVGHFRVGVRVLYSKEKHLIPFLEKCERQQRASSK